MRVMAATKGGLCDRQKLRILGRAISRAAAISWPDMLPEVKTNSRKAWALEGTFFEKVVADAFVGGQKHPTLGADHWEPGLALSATRKVIEVALNTNVKVRESSEDCGRFAEVLVEIENEIVRRRRGGRAPSGWLLRSAAAGDHIRGRDR